MPALDDETLRQSRAKIRYCSECLNFELENYCRQCDEFFIYGHDKNCKRNPHQHEKHEGHRTY